MDMTVTLGHMVAGPGDRRRRISDEVLCDSPRRRKPLGTNSANTFEAGPDSAELGLARLVRNFRAESGGSITCHLAMAVPMLRPWPNVGEIILGERGRKDTPEHLYQRILPLDDQVRCSSDRVEAYARQGDGRG